MSDPFFIIRFGVIEDGRKRHLAQLYVTVAADVDTLSVVWAAIYGWFDTNQLPRPQDQDQIFFKLALITDNGATLSTDQSGYVPAMPLQTAYTLPLP
jgi:hypothetical protein